EYADMSDDALGVALARKFPKEYGDLAPAVKDLGPPAKTPDLPGGIVANLPGALKETFGAGTRPGAVPLTGTPEAKTPLGVVLKPEGALERATSAAVQAPLTAAAGGPVGRIAISAGLSAAEQAAKGNDPLGWGT